MKEIKYILSIIIISGIVLYSGCGGNGGETPLTEQQTAAQALADGSPWTITDVSSAPVDDVSELESLELSFLTSGSGNDLAPDTFIAGGAPNFITATSASWSWAGSGISTISLSGASIEQFTNVSMSPNINDPTQLTL
ncbi:MAG: hypothetical protein ACOCXH_03440, partial [Cyclobacteriaceae bacterium]